MIKTGLVPEEVARFKKYLALEKNERPSWKQMAREFSVEEKLLKNFFPASKKVTRVPSKKED